MSSRLPWAHRKKIVVIAYYFLPWNIVAVRRLETFTKVWARQGHSVTIVTSSELSTVSIDEVDGIRCIRIPCVIRLLRRFFRLLGIRAQRAGDFPRDTGAPAARSQASKPETPLEKPSLLKKLYFIFIGSRGVILGGRLPSLTYFWALRSFLWLKKNGVDADIVFATSPPPVSLLLARGLKKWIFGPNTILALDYRDAWSQDPFYPGLWPFNLLENRLERTLNSNADVLFKACQSIEFSQGDTACVHASNGINYAKVDDVPPVTLPREQQLTLVYTGSVYDEQNWSPLFLALKDINSGGYAGKVRVHVFGSVTQHFLAEIKAANLKDSIVLHQNVAFEESLRIQRHADVCLFLPIASHPRISTGKAFEYVATAGEIWSIGVNELVGPNRLFTDKKVGTIFGNDSQALVIAIRKAIDLKIFGHVPRPVPLRYFSDIDSEMIAITVLNHMLQRLVDKPHGRDERC